MSFGLENVAASARSQSLCNQVRFIMYREDQDFRGRQCLFDLLCCFYTVEFRHLQVEDDEVRFQLQCELHGLAAVACFAPYTLFRLGPQQRDDAFAKDLVVIRHQNPYSPLAQTALIPLKHTCEAHYSLHDLPDFPQCMIYLIFFHAF